VRSPEGRGQGERQSEEVEKEDEEAERLKRRTSLLSARLLNPGTG
jgi:hypothetical protein